MPVPVARIHDQRQLLAQETGINSAKFLGSDVQPLRKTPGLPDLSRITHCEDEDAPAR